MAVDLRRVRVGIEVSGQISWHEGLRVKASGTKYANPLQNECQVTIGGLKASVRDYILSETSPYNANRSPKRLILECGRVSTGLFRIFAGDILSAEPGPPPEVEITLKAKTQSAQSGNIVAISGAAISKLSGISRRVADEMNLGLDFQALDKNIGNFSFSGAAIKLVNQLQETGNVRAFIDDEALIVKDFDKAVSGRLKILNINSGMVGIPKQTEKGVDVTFLIDSESLLGGMLRLESKFNKAISGDYVIDQLKFEVATHDDPFFYTATCTRYGYPKLEPKPKSGTK
jgi:hypothetical protein